MVQDNGEGIFWRHSALFVHKYVVKWERDELILSIWQFHQISRCPQRFCYTIKIQRNDIRMSVPVSPWQEFLVDDKIL